MSAREVVWKAFPHTTRMGRDTGLRVGGYCVLTKIRKSSGRIRIKIYGGGDEDTLD